MDEENDFEDARHEVLAENTAQTVHKHLSKLFVEEGRFQTRWVWELLQNARDAASQDGVKVRLIHEPERLIFRHNGMAFTHKNVAHLIYHGSTKHADSIGQFGTGFLTTHLISKTVTVVGRTEDGRRFSFLLDRRGSDADELKDVMDGSWRAFIKSLTEERQDQGGEYTTEYSYPLVENVSKIVAEGINDLSGNAAYLLAFNDRIQSLEVAGPDCTTTIEKKNTQQIEESTFLIDIEQRTGGGDPVNRRVAVVSEAGTSVAIELIPSGKRWRVIERSETPGIFVAFPLTATRKFCLPVVVNNEQFQPREDRDAPILVGNRDGIHPNMTVMEGACDLSARLAVLAAAEGWHHSASLARVWPLIQWEWLDNEWFRSLLAARFIEPLRQADIMVADSGAKIAPFKSWIPVAVGLASSQDLWKLISQLKDADQRLPRRKEAQVWADNLTNWALILEKAVDEFAEGFTLGKLCQQVSDNATVPAVKRQLAGSAEPLDWLDNLHALIVKEDRADLFDHLRLIPDQSGRLKRITELRRDPGISEELKKIAEHLGLPVRTELANKRMQLKALAELKPMTESELLVAAIQKLKENAKGGLLDDDFRRTNVRFFAWLVRNNYLDELDGFPVLTRATTGDEVDLATLWHDPSEPDEILLAPTGCWPEPARFVADLFPKRHTLADAYREALDDDVPWERIRDAGFVRLSPLYVTRKRIPFIPDEPLAVTEKDKRHQTKELVELSALAFFEKEETGLDGARGSKTRATNLLLFLAKYVLEVDAAALEMEEAECECGETHRHFRSAWLVPMWERKWVPLGDNKRSFATAEAIAQLFEGREDDLRALTAGKGRSLLEALKISLADLALRAVAKDPETRISLIGSLADIFHAAGNDAERVRLVAEEIRDSPEILDQIGEQRKTREKIRRNQLVGAEVERLLSQELAARGLKVTRKPIGSDFEVEHDNIVEGEEVLLSVGDSAEKVLIEVKATFGSTVRMTITQAQTAFANRDRYALCVVTLTGPDITAEAVRNGSRFIMDIGHRVEPALVHCLEYMRTKIKACAPTGDVELELTDTDIRFAVSTDVSAVGLRVDEAVTRFAAARTANPDKRPADSIS